MKILVAIAPDRYRDEELDEPLEIFKKNGIAYDIASTRTGTCKGMLGGKTMAALSFDQADAGAYDALVIIGGAGSPGHLWGNPDLARLAPAFAAGTKVVAAICLAPVVLARAGILSGRKATVFRTPESVAEMKKGGCVLSAAPVVVDGRMITADGPAAATAFGQAVLAALAR
jgi:protease I